MDETMEETKFDPKRRRLCPDGGCIGLIGADGRCNECGRAADGAAPAAARADEPAPAAARADEPAPARAADPLPEGGFDPKRRLCDDGSCTGVLGPDGVCPECGRKAES